MNVWLETPAGDKIPIQGHCSLGREAGNRIVLPGKLVSRKHALIHVQGKDEAILVDLGSSNGTLLNGRRIRMPVELKDQDKLEIGQNVFTFRTGVNTDATTHPAETTSYATIKAIRSADLWLLIADIEKFTPLSQSMPGDQLGKLVGRWIASCKEIIERHGGEINKYLGDGYLAWWPTPGAPPEKIAQAVADLKALQQQETLKFRLIVHYGSVTIDNSLSEGEDALIGPQVNFTFRMEKVAGGLGIHCMVSEAAAAHLKEFGTVKPEGRHTLGGFEGTHALYSY
ncbi:MAG: adenylate/guanylate cyclase domain-containing protein [Verrucomicrobiota bacterium]